MDTSAALAGKLPGGEQDGLSPMADLARLQPGLPMLGVVRLMVKDTVTDAGTGKAKVTFRIDAIEMVVGPEQRLLASTLTAARAARLGGPEV